MTDLRINLAGLLPARRTLDRLSRMRTERLLDILGGELESQTRRRLSEEKTAPDGSAWAPWSDAYAARVKSSASLLEVEGNLIDSIAFEVGTDAVTVGSNLVYAATHQSGTVYGPLLKGRGRTPARPFLGVSDENLADLGELVMDFIAEEAL